MMSSVNHDDLAHLKIPLEDVISATNNFSDENVGGGFTLGDVYVGKLLWSGELIDINAQRWNKEWDDEKEQQFWNEVSMLSSLEHKNLVSFVGFCDENDEKIVIFKCLILGSLESLFTFSNILTWVRRLMICFGVANALSYIHHDEHRDFSVIHRNINSGAILVDENGEPKLSEFRHSMKIEASKRHDSFHVDKVWDREATNIETKSVSHKSDIYSFGIVMFELLCGRKLVIANDIKNKYLLHYREKRLHEIIDSELRDQTDSLSLIIFAGIAYDCLNEEPSQRPNIDEIVTRLNDVWILQLMESSPKDEFPHLRIPFENILSATNNLDDEKVMIDISGMGECYKGQLLWSGELIDILAHRLNKDLNGGEEMFWTEISLLSSLKHKNVVSLVGFCDEDGEKIMIYKRETTRTLYGYLSHSMLRETTESLSSYVSDLMLRETTESLSSYLSNSMLRETTESLSSYLSNSMLLTWVQRLKISVGIAQALSYIHYDELRDFSIIHRNINSSSIQLNDDWEPKLGGFIRSMKIKASERHNSFSTDKVWSTDGYTDPTYIETKSVSHKSDTYSFGIILFELLCGRKAVIEDDGQDNKYLASVAVSHYREKKLNEIIDWELWDQMDSQSFNVFAEIAYDCLNEERSERPNIDEIVTRLERALELQVERQKEIMSLPSNEFAHLKIPLENILSATNNFAQENFARNHQFAKDYRGELLWSGELIDITARRSNKGWFDRGQQFWREVSFLSSLKHKNVVCLVGFWEENDEKIIINKDETRGSLGNYLSPMLLTWVQRLKICVGIAHALSYIHYDTPRDFSVIHRFISSGTVLLNDDWEPKLSEFGHSMKIRASQRHNSFHTNNLQYVDGYGDPTYIKTKSVSHKSDIYSFGIVMFELLCGREAVIEDDQDKKYLASVAVAHYMEKKLNEIIDWELWDQMDSQSFNVFVEIAYGCLNEERSERPNIDEIVTRLEKALELQLEPHNAIMSLPSNEFAHLRVPLQNIRSATNNFAKKMSSPQMKLNRDTRDNCCGPMC